MINLLPEENKKSLLKEYRWRKTIIYEVCLFSLVIISMVVMLSLSYAIYLEGENHKNLLEDAKEDESGERLNFLQKNAKDLRFKIGFFDRFNKANLAVAYLVEEAVSVKPNNVDIFTIQFNRGEEQVLVLKGVSNTRDALLSFVDNLKELSFVKNVESPVTNLIKETEVPFTLNITILGKE